jgi:hypothetical protein
MHWQHVVTVAVLALSLGMAIPVWSQQLEDPLLEEYYVHLIPFYKIDANWSSFLVIADTSYQDLSHRGTDISLKFFTNTCAYRQDARLEVTKTDAQYYPLHDPSAANGQFGGLLQNAPEGVIVLDGFGKRFLTYILLVNGNNNSLIRLDSIPCAGDCRRQAVGQGTWLRYDSYNTVAATFGDSNGFQTRLHFYSAVTNANDTGDLRRELLMYGKPRGNDWAATIFLYGYCDEIFLGSRRLDLRCTQRLNLTALNFTNLNTFPDDACSGTPGHIETFSVSTSGNPDGRAFSGFQETIASLVPNANLIGTGYLHHSQQ